MHRKAHAAVGIVALTAAVTLTSSPARADSVRDAQWHLKYLKVSQAQAITKGSGIVVGVVDTGVYPHPDLKRNLLKGTDIQGGGDGVGHVDENGHGTEVAALIAAHGSGSSGIIGIAPAAKILPVKDANTGADAGSLEVGRGITSAVNGGAKIINVSSGTGPSLEMSRAISSAADSDVVVVAGTGNKSTTGSFAYPAAMPGVLAVGAVDRNGKLADFSITGPKVALCAPGTDIATAEPKTKYVKVDGTSFATAIVSGAAALVRAKFPALSAQEVIHRLTATADDNGPPGKDDQCGYGVLNIVKALTANVPPLGSTASPSTTATTIPATSVPTPATTDTSAVAIPDIKNTGSSAPAVIGVVVVVLVAAGLVGFLLVRRRRSS